VVKDGAKMSKSKGNVVDPDDMIEEYGADSLRLFILFASPPEKEFIWTDEGVDGCFRFLNRLWTIVTENLDLFSEESSGSEEKVGKEARALRVKMHLTIQKVSEDIEKRYHLNTAVSSLMEFYNKIKRDRDVLRKSQDGRAVLKESLENSILLLSPFAPHLCEELWEKTGHKTFLFRTPWPAFDSKLAREERITIVVQVNGKLRDTFEVERDSDEEMIKKEAMDLTRIKSFLGDKKPSKVIYIKNKLVNIVI
jgi:leucyl-tRNA synthetase